MTNTTRARVLRLKNCGYTATGIARAVDEPVEEVRRVLHAERSKRSSKTATERAVELLRREGHDESVIAANFG